MQEVVGSSPTVSTISAASRFSEVKKQRVLRLSSFFYFCFISPPSLYIQGVCRNNVALRFATLTAAARSDESYCLYHFGGFLIAVKINATEKIPLRFYFCCLSLRPLRKRKQRFYSKRLRLFSVRLRRQRIYRADKGGIIGFDRDVKFVCPVYRSVAQDLGNSRSRPAKVTETKILRDAF